MLTTNKQMEIYGIEILREGKSSLWYVGKSSRSSAVRFTEHLNGTTQKVDQAIKKYGQDATRLHIFCEDIEDETELNRLEVLYIQLMETYVGDKKGGLNMTRGGEGARKYEISKEELQGYIDAGLSDTEICVRLGNLSNDTLKSWMKSYGIKRKSLFQQHEATIRQMVADGKHLGEISTATGIDSVSLGIATRLADLKVAKKKYVNTTPEMEEQVRTLTAEGKSSYGIEQLLGISRGTVQNIRKKLGIKSTAKNGLTKGAVGATPELIAKVLELRATGLSNYAISRQVGCSEWTARAIVNGKYDHLLK